MMSLLTPLRSLFSTCVACYHCLYWIRMTIHFIVICPFLGVIDRRLCSPLEQEHSSCTDWILISVTDASDTDN
ncbi:uncharacterized protein BJ212DRAFT_1348173 [Suillus subaureus]|uniref:Uncharacterized protein n=1 Tax=Suillus subaureus TaxID=48587 RepID=A0A9P7ECK9_9AGAM|nr:uncharacterized protein BJ212DRAFT_1348173 [Suillus subaureus]KAG1817999.1 hypothetical protein BJ212DRAFT_1348173 [Suillus subaureus]